MTKSRVVAIIPARYASVRFEGKPLAMIGDKTMIQRVWERAKEIFEECYVATDDSRIEAEVVRFGGEVIMTSPNHQSGTDRICEAVSKLSYIPDIVINIQGDEPFIAQEQLRAIVELFEDENCEIATLVQPITKSEDIFNPNCVKAVVGSKGYALYFSRSPIPFVRSTEQTQWLEQHKFLRHIGLYGYRYSTLKRIAALPLSLLERAESLEQLRWLEDGVKIKTELTTIESHGIDTKEDLERVLSLIDCLN